MCSHGIAENCLKMTINTCKSKQLVGVATTTWLTNTKYPYAKWHCIFFFLFRCFIPPSLPRFLSDLTVYMGNTAGVVWQAGTTYPGVTSRCWWGSFCSSFLVFFVVFCFFVFVFVYCFVWFVFVHCLWIVHFQSVFANIYEWFQQGYAPILYIINYDC